MRSTRPTSAPARLQVGAPLARRAAWACAALAVGLAPCPSRAASCAHVFTTPDTISAGEPTYEGCDITVSGTTLYVRGPHTFASLVVTAGGAVRAVALDSITIAVEGDLRIEAGGRITADGRGFPIGSGPGVGGGSPGGGGSHGGHGGVGGSAGGPTYGTFAAPITFGSGGGLSGASNANGGGAVRLVAGGELRIDGELSARGDTASTLTPAYSPGGGAGGSVHVQAGTLSGGGRIDAGGGKGFNLGGGGGGGRIAVRCSSLAFTGVIVACGGTSPVAGRAGAAGTIWIDDASAPPAELRIANCGLATNARTDMPDTSVVVDGAMRVVESGVVGVAKGVPLALTVLGDLFVDAGAAISMDGCGHPTGAGPGAGGGGSPGGAGSHGGRGGNGEAASGPTYGSITDPVDLGSGGGLSGVSKSSGGGALRLTVAGELRVDGTLSARGDTASTLTPSYDPGGGSGGSLRVTAGSFAGTGRLEAGGGLGFDQGPGGGGGRIAVEYASSTFTGEMSACGAPAAVAGAAGAAGTIWTRDLDEALGALVVANCDRWTLARTELPDTATVVEGSLEVSGAAIVGVAAGSPLHVTVSGDLTIEAGAGLSVDGCGYALGTGPGAGGGGSPAAGGSHGGRGGSTNVQSGPTYGSALFPVDFGSGGGQSGVSKSSGGGVLQLDVAGRIQVDGRVSARGDSATTLTPGYAPGGGAGGSLRITAGVIGGTGDIDASGGPGLNGGGGGGGGRVKIESLCWDGFALGQIRVAGGSGGGTPAEAGSIVPDFEVGISAGVIATAGAVRDLGSPLSLEESALESPDSLSVMKERGGLQLAAGDSIAFDITSPGVVADDPARTPSVAAAGTWVNSHVIHLDAPGAGTARARGSVTFDTNVIGVIVSHEALAASDELLHAPGVRYPASPERGVELAGAAGRDTIELSSDRRTVTFSSDVHSGLDQIRVVTAVPLATCGPVADVEPAKPAAGPDAVLMAPPFPNPARGRVSLRFALPTASRVNLDVFDAAGRRVARLLDGEVAAGWHIAEWGALANGSAAGVYFARLTTPAGGRTVRVVVR